MIVEANIFNKNQNSAGVELTVSNNSLRVVTEKYLRLTIL